MLRLIDAQLRYYHNTSQRELNALSDEEWAEQWRDLMYIREQEKKQPDLQ